MENKNLSRIEWFCLKKDGIRLVEPNERVGKEYINSSDSDFSEFKNANLKWKNIVAYYACYNSFYAILQKIGIKCEIHDGTLELTGFIKGFSEKQIKLINWLKTNRIGVQYYLEPPKQINEKEVADFILTCKHIFSTLNYDLIKKIRSEVDKIIKLAREKSSREKLAREKNDTSKNLS